MSARRFWSLVLLKAESIIESVINPIASSTKNLVPKPIGKDSTIPEIAASAKKETKTFVKLFGFAPE